MSSMRFMVVKLIFIVNYFCSNNCFLVKHSKQEIMVVALLNFKI